MKASEVIKQLQELINQHGDVDVVYFDYDYSDSDDIGTITFQPKIKKILIN